METPIEISPSVIKTIKDIFDLREKRRAFLQTDDSACRDAALDALKKLKDPTGEESALMRQLASDANYKTSTIEQIDKDEAELYNRLLEELQTWLRGKYVHDERHRVYMLVHNVVMTEQGWGHVTIFGPSVEDDVPSAHAVHTAVTLFEMASLDSNSIVDNLKRIMSRFKWCELSDMVNIVKLRRDNLVNAYNDMINQVELYPLLEMPEKSKVDVTKWW